jgi:hypothetical protein
MIKLFDINDGNVVPTEHCYTISFLKDIMDNYPEEYIKIYGYLFYLSCRSSENPYFNRPQDELDMEILRDLKASFDPEDPLIITALKRTRQLYETPTIRAYNGISHMLEKLAVYMNTQTITDGRDGNITAIINAAKNFQSIRQSFKGIAKDLEDEQSSRARGNQKLSYDEQ